MNDWLTESTRIFIDNLLKEDLGLGHSVSDGQTKTIMINSIPSNDPTILDEIQTALKTISPNKIDRVAEKNLKKILNYLNTLT